MEGSEFEIYELITRYFLASLSPDAKFKCVDVEFSIEGELFDFTARQLKDAGFLLFLPAQRRAAENESFSSSSLPPFISSQKWPILQIKVEDALTSPPDYLTESDLITLMERNKIGTDASLHTHISTICERNYVTVNPNSRKLVPTKLGVTLVHGFQQMDEQLVQPTVCLLLSSLHFFSFLLLISFLLISSHFISFLLISSHFFSFLLLLSSDLFFTFESSLLFLVNPHYCFNLPSFTKKGSQHN